MGYVITAMLVAGTSIFTNVSTVCAKVQNHETIEELVTTTQKKACVSNMSVVTVKQKDISYYGSGKANEIFQIGSMTKAFTGLGVQKLVEDGKIQIEDSVTEYLPDFRVYRDGKEVSITVRQLLNHTSGFTNSEKDYPSATQGMSLQDWYVTINDSGLSVQPGEKFNYSNVNYNLLGCIIEKVTGISYKEYMENEILTPLGLTNTFCGVLPEQTAAVKGTRLLFGKNITYERPISEGSVPAGYFYSCAEDMQKWIQYWNGMLEIPTTLKPAFAGVLRMSNTETYYGGWYFYENGLVGHSGGTPNFSSRVMFDTVNKTGCCVLSNLNCAASTDQTCEAIMECLHGNKEIPTFVYDIWRIFDIIFMVVTICAILFGALTIYRYGMDKKQKKTAGAVLIMIGGILLTGVLIALCIVLPIIFQASWYTILSIWAPYSLGLGMVALLSVSIIMDVSGCKLLAMKKRIKNQKTTS